MEGAVQLLWLLLFVVAFYLLLIRPQRKRQRQLMDLQRSVDVGDEVMLSAGVFARVTGEVDDPAAGDCLLVELAPGVEVKIARGAVMRVVQPPVDDTDADSLGADEHPHSTPHTAADPVGDPALDSPADGAAESRTDENRPG